MDPRVPELQKAIVEALDEKVANLIAASVLIEGRPETLTHDDVTKALALATADLPCPLRATLFDLGRILSGTLPTEDIIVPAPGPLRIFSPAGS